MTTTTIGNIDALSARVLTEGYGPGAWHGPELKTALADVRDDLAFWRPGSNRHNIAEIARHHAYRIRNVFAKITGSDPGAFVVEGDDWFDVPGTLSWQAIQDVVEREQSRLVAADRDVATGRITSPLSPSERFDVNTDALRESVPRLGQRSQTTRSPSASRHLTKATNATPPSPSILRLPPRVN